MSDLQGDSPTLRMSSLNEDKPEGTLATVNEDAVVYPKGLKLFLIALALCLSVFLVALDSTIIGMIHYRQATAIPKITDQFNSLDDVGWYGSAYLLTTAAFQLLFGRFYSFLSMKWVYIAAISIFEIGSLICGVAPNSTALIVGRAIAGLGSAGIFSGALIIVANTVELERRPIYMGLIAATYGVASDGRIIALLVLFGVFISIFIGIQIWKQDMATVPPRILKQRSIWSGMFFALCLGSSFFILVYFLPIWVQAIKGVTAVKSGIDNLPMILSLVISSLLAGGIITAMGYYTPFMIISSIFMAVLYGLGVGLGMQQPIIAAQTVLSLKDIPTGTSLIMFSQTLGGALFVSVGQNIFTNKLTSGLVRNVPGVSPAIVLNAGATSLRDAVDPQYLSAVISVYNEALVNVFYVSIAMAGLSLAGALAMEWRSIKGQNIEVAMG
ncbi:major facilitator superfamily transporter [Mycena metata]|uniref:Major facilitator superfamily transporter n=1 Tax=Mycena metata TaxID=1033252 RepID=A0AAD7NJX2_9AGAR|nr:major facilitator superfamily transporter [Mycena metata]